MASRCRGFTLIELIITLMVVGILAAAGASALTGGAVAFNTTTDSIDTLSKLRMAVQRMSREIREIKRNTGGYAITTMQPSALAFTKADGTQVTIQASGSQASLTYSTVPGTYTLCDQLGSLTFKYYQADDAKAATSASNVAFISVELVLGSGSGSYAQRTQVALRNGL
ncbi:MAG: prepilin-type N-terminal cleavage/methylation domain-containing protein [Gammaproteobacteria bacterium]